MKITTANKPMFHNVNFEKADTGDDFLTKVRDGVNFQHCHISRDVEWESVFGSYINHNYFLYKTPTAPNKWPWHIISCCIN